jgi:hypothetical protein
LLDGSPPGSTAVYHPSGWMQTEIFIKWFHRFIEFSKSTEIKHVLLLLDGHERQTKSVELIELARKSHVVHHTPPTIYNIFMFPLWIL